MHRRFFLLVFLLLGACGGTLPRGTSPALAYIPPNVDAIFRVDGARLAADSPTYAEFFEVSEVPVFQAMRDLTVYVGIDVDIAGEWGVMWVAEAPSGRRAELQAVFESDPNYYDGQVPTNGLITLRDGFVIGALPTLALDVHYHLITGLANPAPVAVRAASGPDSALLALYVELGPTSASSLLTILDPTEAELLSPVAGSVRGFEVYLLGDSAGGRVMGRVDATDPDAGAAIAETLELGFRAISESPSRTASSEALSGVASTMSVSASGARVLFASGGADEPLAEAAVMRVFERADGDEDGMDDGMMGDDAYEPESTPVSVRLPPPSPLDAELRDFIDRGQHVAIVARLEPERDALLRAMRASPGELEALELAALGRAFASTGRTNDADAVLRELISLLPSVIARNDFGQGLRMDLAYLPMRRGDFDAGITAFTALCQDDAMGETRPYACALRAMAMAEAGRRDEAFVAIAEIPEAEDIVPMLQNNRAWMHHLLGSPADGLPLVDLALQAQSSAGSRASYVNTRAVLLADLGRWDEAAAEYDRELLLRDEAYAEDHPARAVPMLELGVVEARRGRFDKAERWARRGLGLRVRAFGEGSPETGAGHMALARVLLLAGRRDEAIAEARLAVASYAHSTLPTFRERRAAESFVRSPTP